jgi:AsmA protein
MRHGAIAAGVALGAAIGLVLGTVRWPIDPSRVKRELTQGFGAVDAPVRASLTLLPRPTLRVVGVHADGAGLRLSASSAEATLGLGGLFTGAFEVLGLTLHDADLHIDLDAAGPALAALARRPLTALTVKGGTVELLRPSRGWTTNASVTQAQFAWSAPDGPLRGVGTGRWRGQPIDVSAELGLPLDALRGGASSLRFSLDAPLAQLRLAGDLAPTGEAQGDLFLGQASALAPSLPRLARWLGRAAPEALPLGGMELETKISATRSGARLGDATLTLGGQAFEGALDVSRGAEGVAVSGSLAADTLDLEPLLGPPPAWLDGRGGWSNRPILPAPVPGLDLDLRVSASRAVWAGQALDDAAAAISQKQGRLSVKLLEAGYAHGALSGEMSVEERDGACRTEVAALLENADLGDLLGNFGARAFTGQGSLKLNLRARGRSPAEIVGSADGEATVDIADGSVSSLNFEEALRRGRRRLIDVARDMSAGATRFGAAHGRVEISAGEARFVDAATQAPGVSLAVTGAIDLAGRAWRAHVAARESADDGQPTPDGARLDFALFGPWSGPVLTPLLPPAD